MKKIIIALLFAPCFAWAGSYTTDLNLYKPAQGDRDYVTPFATGMDTLDAAIPDKRTGKNATIHSSWTIRAPLNVVGTMTATAYYGDGSNLTGITGGGGVSVATFTTILHSGGDVYIASGSFIPAIGMAYVYDQSTATITGVKCYTLVTSTTGSTFFNIARSSDTGTTTGWGYMFTNAIEVSTNAKYSDWVIPNNYAAVSSLPSAYSLHITRIPTAVTQAQEYGCLIRWWKQLNQ